MMSYLFLSTDHFLFDSNTLRRNTYSAPHELDRIRVPNVGDEHAFVQSADNALSRGVDPRGRAATFTAKRGKIDRHVLLKHEEVLDDSVDLNILRSQSSNSFTTEL